MAEIDRDWEVTVQDVHTLRDSRAPHLLIDVREPHEFAVCKIEGARLFPLSALAGRAEEIAELADGRPIITHCHHGMRSLRAAAFLRNAGITDVKSMHGGIDAWSMAIDPTVPRY